MSSAALLLTHAAPRYFGFVIGGSMPVALAAYWLVSTWDQNAGIHVMSPIAAAMEEIAARWLLDLFDLRRESGVGFVTGCQMAHFTCLAAARHGALRRAGRDVSPVVSMVRRAFTSSLRRKHT